MKPEGSVVFSFVFLLFLAISIGASAQNKDVDWLKSVHQGNSASWDQVNKVISQSMIPASIAAPSAVLIYGLLKHDSLAKRNGILIGASLASSAALTIGLKYAVDRQRPFEAYPLLFQKKDVGGGPSFPSGHTSSAFSTATSLSLCYPKWYVIAPSALWAVGVGYSRMELGVHYPTDVIAGAIIGAGCAWIAWRVNRNLNKQ